MKIDFGFITTTVPNIYWEGWVVPCRSKWTALEQNCYEKCFEGDLWPDDFLQKVVLGCYGLNSGNKIENTSVSKAGWPAEFIFQCSF